MAQSRPLVRVLGALAAVMLIAGIGAALFLGNSSRTRSAKNTPTSTPAAATGTTGAAAVTGATGAEAAAPVVPNSTGAQPSTSPNPAPTTPLAATGTVSSATPKAESAAAASTAPAGGLVLPLSVKQFKDDPAAVGPWEAIGSLTPPAAAGTTTPGYEMEVRFSPAGAGIDRLTLANHYDSILPSKKHEVLQSVDNSHQSPIVPLALLAVQVNDQVLGLAGTAVAANVWRQTAPGAFEAQIVDANGVLVATISRRFALEAGRYDLTLEQSVKNHSGQALNLILFQVGPSDLPAISSSGGTDVRRFRVGYLTTASSNPDGQTVLAKRYIQDHAHLISPLGLDGQPAPMVMWPTAETKENDDTLAFVALTNRYFAVATMPLPERHPKRPDGQTDKSWSGVREISRIQATVLGSSGTPDAAHSKVALRLDSKPMTAPAGGSVDFSMGVYAGPITLTHLSGTDRLKAMGLREIRLFTFGGPCACCTFQPVAQFLRAFLGFLHDYIVFDWALAIILLVLCVKTILHPITYWSQSRMTRFGKQMGAVAPKIAKLKEKYADDPARFREEQMKLMREEEINYAGMLGCLPMFLQTPIWIALYAMIYFTFELRHEGAFYGVFQAITGGSWGFLGDLAEPDHFIPLGFSFHIPIISSLVPTIGEIKSINLLPLLLGAVFYIQQKYLTPPTTTQMTPEQEMTQKIMKVMIVVMFPLFMYNAPSALAIYFICNSTVGIIESRRIRRNVDEEDKRREELKKAGVGKPGREVPKAKGFFARIQDELEKRQKDLEEKRRKEQKDQKKK